jgi:hypothetical protein
MGHIFVDWLLFTLFQVRAIEVQNDNITWVCVVVSMETEQMSKQISFASGSKLPT